MQFECARLTKQEELRAWRSMRKGDVDAKHRLLISVVPWVMRIAHKYASNPDEREELIAAGNLHMVAALAAFDPRKGRLTTFTYRCLSRLYYRLYEQRQLRHCQPLGKSEHVGLEAHEVDLAEQLDRAHCVARVRRALRTLPPRDRDVVKRRMAGETFREIAAALGVSKQRIQQLETRAHSRLRELLSHVEGVSA